MNHESLTHQFFNASTLPKEPDITEFKIRPNSSMGKLSQTFARVGVNFHTGKKSLFIAEPTNDQKRQLKAEGIELHSRQIKCSPRRG